MHVSRAVGNEQMTQSDTTPKWIVLKLKVIVSNRKQVQAYRKQINCEMAQILFTVSLNRSAITDNYDKYDYMRTRLNLREADYKYHSRILHATIVVYNICVEKRTTDCRNFTSRENPDLLSFNIGRTINKYIELLAPRLKQNP